MLKKILSHKITQKIRLFTRTHKVWSAVILIALILALYWGVGKVRGATTPTRFVLATAERRHLVVSISGTGQVAATNQIDIKPKVSGDVIWIGAKSGAQAAAGAALLSLDDTDARIALTNAELDLAETKLQTDKAAAQAPIDFTRKNEALATAKRDLAKISEDVFSSVSAAYLDLPGVMTGIDTILHGKELGGSSGQWNLNAYRDLFKDAGSDSATVNAFADAAERDYQNARTLYDAGFAKFKAQARTTDIATNNTALEETLAVVRAAAQAVKSEVNLLDTVVDLLEKNNRPRVAQLLSFQSQARGFLSTINNRVTALLSQQQSAENAAEQVTNLERDVAILLVNNPSGALPIDLLIARDSIKKKEVSVTQLKTDLSHFVVRAPFAGTIAKVNAKVGDTVSPGTALLSFISFQKVAEISLNEVDAAQVKVGEKAALTFDAVQGLRLTGTVAEIDTVGTVSQGVVTYALKISFDADDARVKPGMSVSAAITTAEKEDALVVPASAVKTAGRQSFVEVFDPPLAPPPKGAAAQGVVSAVAPTRTQVEVGLSNDLSIEILSGIAEGAQVVARTITAAAAAATPQAPSLFGGGNRGGGAIRAIR